MPMEDTYGIQSRIGSIIVVERWYCCRGSPVFSDRNIHKITLSSELPNNLLAFSAKSCIISEIRIGMQSHPFPAASKNIF